MTCTKGERTHAEGQAGQAGRAGKVLGIRTGKRSQRHRECGIKFSQRLLTCACLSLPYPTSFLLSTHLPHISLDRTLDEIQLKQGYISR